MSIREVCKLGPAFIMTVALLQGASSSASGQLYTADPYDPAGRGFRQYAYPGAEEGYPGSYAARARIARQTQFDRADDDLGFSTTGRGGRRGRYDDERLNDQDPRPTDKADRQYYAARDRRERAMVAATRETDPKKRDRMVREADQESRRAASDLSLSVRRSAANRATIPPAPLQGDIGQCSEPSGRHLGFGDPACAGTPCIERNRRCGPKRHRSPTSFKRHRRGGGDSLGHPSSAIDFQEPRARPYRSHRPPAVRRARTRERARANPCDLDPSPAVT